MTGRRSESAKRLQAAQIAAFRSGHSEDDDKRVFPSAIISINDATSGVDRVHMTMIMSMSMIMST